MHLPWLLCATAVLWDRVGAAPRSPGDQIPAHVVQNRGFLTNSNSHSVSGRGQARAHLNVTNATTSTGVTEVAGGTPVLSLNLTSTYQPSSVCPLSVITSTKTLDVTFYITATTSYSDNVTSTSTGSHIPPTISFSQTYNEPTTSRGAWNHSSPSSWLSTKSSGSVGSSVSSMATSTTITELPCKDATPQNSTTITPSTIIYATTTKSEGTPTSVSRDTTLCDNTTSTFTSTLDTSPTPGGTPSSSSAETLITTSSCNDETSTIVSLTTSSATSLSSHSISIVSSEATNPTSLTSSVTTLVATQTRPALTSTLGTQTSRATVSCTSDIIGTPPTPVTYTPTQTASCVIDTSMVPVASATFAPVPSPTLVPTKTVCQNDAPTGKPKPGNHHCGVHGLPVGSYFLAQFVENSPAVPVTLEGCYQFCASVMNATNGCKSYRFYPERGLNVPRCDLYGSSVAYALDSINNDHPDMWFDLTCESPSDQKWAHLPGMNRLRDLGLLL